MSEEEKREADVILVLGRQGVGKTFREVKECQAYAMNDVQRGRRGRKVLIFDCNVRSGSYKDIKTIGYNNSAATPKLRCAEISAWDKNTNECRRVVNYRSSDGEMMSMDEMNQVALDLMENFYDGRLVMEDTNAYLHGAGQKKFVSNFVRVRHKNVDFVLVLQGWSAVNPRFAGNVSLIRLHKTFDSCDKQKGKLAENYLIVKLSELIVDKQYELGNERFFVYINLRKHKISGTNETAFRFACREYLLMNPMDLKRHMAMKEILDKNKAIESWATEKMRLYLPQAQK